MKLANTKNTNMVHFRKCLKGCDFESNDLFKLCFVARSIQLVKLRKCIEIFYFSISWFHLLRNKLGYFNRVIPQLSGSWAHYRVSGPSPLDKCRPNGPSLVGPSWESKEMGCPCKLALWAEHSLGWLSGPIGPFILVLGLALVGPHAFAKLLTKKG